MCLRVLKESNKSRFDRCSRQKQCIDHIPCYLSELSRAHFSDNLSRNSCMSFVKSWQEKCCRSHAETWRVKNILMKDFDWQVKLNIFIVSMATWTIEYNLKISLLLSFHSGACACVRGAPYLIKFGKLSIRENLVMTSPYVRTDCPGRGK